MAILIGLFINMSLPKVLMSLFIYNLDNRSEFKDYKNIYQHLVIWKYCKQLIYGV